MIHPKHGGVYTKPDAEFELRSIPLFGRIPRYDPLVDLGDSARAISENGDQIPLNKWKETRADAAQDAEADRFGRVARAADVQKPPEMSGDGVH